MLQDERKTHATLEIVPDEVRMHIASYLDTQSLCFFAATSRRSLGNALAEMKQRRQRMLAQMPLQARGNNTFCYTSDSLYACGRNQYGQLGVGHKNDCDRLTRVEDVPGTILQVVSGDEHTMVLTDQGLYTSGRKHYGQLSIRPDHDFGIEYNRLARVEQLPGRILQVESGSGHTFVLTDQGLYACGHNRCGQLGLGHNNNCNQLMRVEALPGAILQVVAGVSHTLALTDQGLYACGDNQYGQLGLGDKNNRSTITPVSKLPVELKRWFSHWRQLNHLIAISTSDATYEQDEPEALPPAAKCTIRL